MGCFGEIGDFFTCPVQNTLAEADSHALAYSCGDKAFKTSLYTGASSLLWLIVVVYYMSRNKRFRVVVNHDTHDNHGNRQGTPEVSWWHVRHQLQLHHHGGLASASYALTLGRALIISIAGLAILMLGPFYWWLAPSDYECQFLSRPSLGFTIGHQARRVVRLFHESTNHRHMLVSCRLPNGRRTATMRFIIKMAR